MFYVYIIKGKKSGKFYIGSTQDVEERLRQHAIGNTRSLKDKGPFVLVHKEDFQTRTEARKRENQIKRYKGGNAFKKLIIGKCFGDVV